MRIAVQAVRANAAKFVRRAVTELKIKGNTLPYIVTLDEIGAIYRMSFVRVSYSVTACRDCLIS